MNITPFIHQKDLDALEKDVNMSASSVQTIIDKDIYPEKLSYRRRLFDEDRICVRSDILRARLESEWWVLINSIPCIAVFLLSKAASTCDFESPAYLCSVITALFFVGMTCVTAYLANYGLDVTLALITMQARDLRKHANTIVDCAVDERLEQL